MSLCQSKSLCRSMSEHVGACRSMSEHVGACRSMSEYVGVCRSMSEYVGVMSESCRSMSESCRSMSETLRRNPTWCRRHICCTGGGYLRGIENSPKFSRVSGCDVKTTNCRKTGFLMSLSLVFLAVPCLHLGLHHDQLEERASCIPKHYCPCMQSATSHIKCTI
jgi:hypothetical protein